MSSDKLERIEQEYKAGRYAFERGQYREAVQHLEVARSLLDQNSRLGGEVQIWLVTAYEASGEGQKAIALCKQLTRHPHLETRKQGRRLIAILEAPKLKMHPEWHVQIPDMSNLDERESKFAQVRVAAGPKPPPRKRTKPEVEPVDLSLVNTKDNSFIWVALGAIALILGGLLWFS